MKQVCVRLLGVLCVIWLLVSAISTAGAQTGAACNLVCPGQTGDIDIDYVGKPHVIIRNGTDPGVIWNGVTTGYKLTDPPISTSILQSGAAAPSGFHISRVAVSTNRLTCDGLCIAFDTSNPVKNPAGTTVSNSVAWDADGDGNPCTTNPAIDGQWLTTPGVMDPNFPAAKQDLASPINSRRETYVAQFDFDNDNLPDLSIQLIDDGNAVGPAGTLSEVSAPCAAATGYAGKIHVVAVGVAAIPAGLTVSVVPFASSAPFTKDLEFSVSGLTGLVLSGGGVFSSPCSFGLKTFADSDWDQSDEVSINWGQFNFNEVANPSVTCSITPKNPTLTCPLGDVTFQACATNTSTACEDITIGGTVFPLVAPGAQVCAQIVRHYNNTFCGSPGDLVTMNASAVWSGCCWTNNTPAACSDFTSVSFPPTRQPLVTCSKTIDKNQACPPFTATYNLCATNTSAFIENITITDATLGVNQTFTNVAAGATVCVTPKPTQAFNTTFCGHADITNTMNASAVLSDPCCAINSPATCSSSATLTFPPTKTPLVTCSKTIDKNQACPPFTATYNLCATNTAAFPENITIVDASLSINQTFTSVAAGATVCITPKPTKLFDATFCSHADVSNTMNVSAVPTDGCCAINSPATCSSTATLTFPTTKTPLVTCSKTIDKNGTCPPFTATYNLCATNTAAFPEDITITDASLSVTQTFTNVAAGATVCVAPKPTKLFDTTFCGHADITNTMNASAVPTDPCCGTVGPPATCSSSATITFPQTKTPLVTCSKVATKNSEVLPFTVTYSLCATNTAAFAEDITITDADFGITHTFVNVAAGATVCITPSPQRTFDTSFCGHVDIPNTMNVSAIPTEACCGGAVSPPATCSSTAITTFPLGASVSCAAQVNGAPAFTIPSLPGSVTYVFTATNTSAHPENIRIADSSFPFNGTFQPIIDETFPCVPAGESRSVTRVVTFDASFATSACITNTMTATGDLNGCVTGAVCTGQPCQSSVTVCFTNKGLNQAVAADSNGQSKIYKGYLGATGDTITAIGGVLQIIPGTNWANFVKAAQSGVPYQIKNITLRKTTPQTIQCADVFPPKVITQQGTPAIRLWWPLLYEVPGTNWELTINYGTTVLWDDGTGPRYDHVDIHHWSVDADLQSMQVLLAAFHELPFGLDEVPLISDEALYPVLQKKLTDIQAFLDANDKVKAGLLLGDFEMEVMDACIAVSPARPIPTGTGTGIGNTLENPACCKLLVDSEYVGFKFGIFSGGK